MSEINPQKNLDPQKNLEKINKLKEKYNLLLEDFKQSYLNYQENPDSNEYQDLFNTKKIQLQSAHDECIKLTENTQQNIKNYESEVESKINSLSDTKDEYDELVEMLRTGKNMKRSSNIMVDDYSSSYNKIYYKNLLLVFGIFMIGVLIFKYSNDGESSSNRSLIFILLIGLLIIILFSKYVSFNLI